MLLCIQIHSSYSYDRLFYENGKFKWDEKKKRHLNDNNPIVNVFATTTDPRKK
jgi:hypothetical protein